MNLLLVSSIVLLLQISLNLLLPGHFFQGLMIGWSTELFNPIFEFEGFLIVKDLITQSYLQSKQVVLREILLKKFLLLRWGSKSHFQIVDVGLYVLSGGDREVLGVGELFLVFHLQHSCKSLQIPVTIIMVGVAFGMINSSALGILLGSSADLLASPI